jgi:hypothetical protein
MNTEFEVHRSDFPGFPEGPFVLVAGRLQSEPDLALSGERGKTRGIGMIIRFPRRRESDSLWACRRPAILMACRPPS